jgi:hypothetical protein
MKAGACISIKPVFPAVAVTSPIVSCRISSAIPGPNEAKIYGINSGEGNSGLIAPATSSFARSGERENEELHEASCLIVRLLDKPDCSFYDSARIDSL